MRRCLLAATLLLVCAPVAHAGVRPGPPLLYAKAPHVPQLENRAPFKAKPLLVSGTDAYRDETGSIERTTAIRGELQARVVFERSLQ